MGSEFLSCGNGPLERAKPFGLTRVGVVGCGYWGSKHVRVLAGLPGVEVTAIDDRSDRLLEMRTHFPSIGVARRLSDVQDKLDAVVIATPPESHGRIGQRALRAGLHTLIEKPLTTTVAEAEALVEMANASGTTLMVGNTFEYNAAVWKLKEVIASGELGRILYIDTARLSLGAHQHDCNVIWDLAPHDLSILSFLLDEFPATVSVWAQRNVGDTHDDVAYLRLEFPRSSVSAFVHVSWLNPDKVRRVTVVGERKMAVYNDLSDNERIRIYDKCATPAEICDGPDQQAMPVTYRSGDITAPYVPFVEPLLVEDKHFVDCVRRGQRPKTPGENGLQIVRALAATDEARASGRPVRIHVPAVEHIESAHSSSFAGSVHG